MDKQILIAVVSGFLGLTSLSAQSVKLVFPQVADGGGVRTEIVLTNPGISEEEGTIYFYGDDGQALTLGIGGAQVSSLPYSVSPGGVFRIETDGSGATKAGYATVVVGTSPYASPVTGNLVFTLPGGQVSVSSADSRAQFHIFAQRTQSARTGLAFANPGSQSASVLLLLRDGAGHEVARKTIELAAGQHLSRFIDELFSNVPEAFTGSLHVDSNTDVYALGLRQESDGSLSTLAGSATALIDFGGKMVAMGSNAVISGNGEVIAFFKEGELWMVNFDGSGLRQVTQGAMDNPAYPDQVHNENLMTISDDGGKVVFSFARKDAADTELFVVDTSTPTPVAPTRLSPGFRPSISGDGSKIVFQNEGAIIPGEPAIFVINSDGSGLKRISPIAEDCEPGVPCHGSFHPKISGKGDKVVFVSREHASQNSDLFLVDSDGSNLKQLTFSGISGPVTINDAGDTIAFRVTQIPDYCGVRAIEAGSGPFGHQILPTPISIAEARDNPTFVNCDLCGNGTRVLMFKGAFWSGSQLYVVGSGGAALRRIFDGDGLSASLDNGGTRIVIAGVYDTSQNVWLNQVWALTVP
ncbi:MAG: hypothetical protein EHM61_19370 [Acidobacteria bacterium]|nr:MAG: hypothetical protein EHM61_19370 [Acidobacteriota bacterium]